MDNVRGSKYGAWCRPTSDILLTLCEGRSPLLSCAMDAPLERWAEARGVSCCFHAASFDGLRGAAASRDVHEGDVLCALPPSSWVTARECAVDLEGVSDDASLIVWTLREHSRGDASPFAPLLRALPQGRLHTGLTLCERAVERLGDTLCGQQAQRLREAAREQYDTLLPLLASLGVAADYALYCWAVEIWQAYAVAVTRVGSTTRETALLPLLFLLNHRAHDAHAVRFSLPDEDGVLRVRAARACGRGEQLFLSYGALANAELLCFYGFTLTENPHDEVPLTFGPDDENGAAQSVLAARWNLEWEQSLRARTPLSESLLQLMSLLTAGAEELEEMLQAGEEQGPPPASAAGLQALGDTLEALAAQLPPPEEEEEKWEEKGEREEMRHVGVYLESQRRILGEAAAEVAARLAALDDAA